MVGRQFVIRSMCEEDIDLGLRLGELAGWNQTQRDWLRFVRYQPAGCFVGMFNETPVATITTTSYGKELAWIGMMLVHPDYRRRGLASALMQHALTWLEEQEVQCVKLDATPQGATVYEQLGFQQEWDFQRFARAGESNSEPLRIGSDSFDVKRGVEIDRAAFGVDRSEWLSRLARDSQVEVLSDGFGMLRPGRLAAYLGPVIASTPQAAESLIGRLTQKTTAPIFWDVPGPNPVAVQLAARFGFLPVRPLSRMWRGKKLVTGDMEVQFALASPATG